MTDNFKQLQKNEVLKILKFKYGLPEYVVKDFDDSDTKYYSEHVIYKDE